MMCLKLCKFAVHAATHDEMVSDCWFVQPNGHDSQLGVSHGNLTQARVCCMLEPVHSVEHPIPPSR